MRRRALPVLTVIVSSGLALSGCGLISNQGGTAAAVPSSSATGAITLVAGSAAVNGISGDGAGRPVAGTANPPAQWIQLDATDSPIGKTVAEVHGLKLYRFDQDKTKPSTSACSADCATTWPPVTITPGGNVYVTGVDKDKVGAMQRTDGSAQLTLDGWPMYTYSGDKAPGDLLGQGVGGTWFAFAPDGSKITGAPGASGAPGAGTDTTGSLNAKQTDQGIVVTDEAGAVVYRNVGDAEKPSVSTCSGDCTREWKPVTAKPGGTVTINGIDKSRVGTWQRPDGTTQLTLDKYPVYVSTSDADKGSLLEGVSVQGWYPAK